MLQSAPKHVIFILKIQTFSREGAQPPPQTPLPAGNPSAPAAPQSSRLRRSLTHPTRKSGDGPELTYDLTRS